MANEPASRSELAALLEIARRGAVAKGTVISLDVVHAEQIIAELNAPLSERGAWRKVPEGEDSMDTHRISPAEARAGCKKSFHTMREGEFYEYDIEVPPLPDERKGTGE